MGSIWSSAELDDQDDKWISDARYAMESGAFCVVCGAPFDIEGDVYNLDPKKPQCKWLSNLRLLGDFEALGAHRLTSGPSQPVNTSNEKDIFLSERAAFRTAGYGAFRVLDDTRTDDIWYNTLCHSSNSKNTLFPLHEACIDISCRAIQNVHFRMEDTNLEPTLATLYQFLNIRYSNRHEMVELETKLMNDIFELCHWSGLYGPRSVLAMTKAEWWGGGYDRFYADPIDISDIADFIHDVLSVSSSEVPAKGIPQNSEQEYRGIERLPNELLDAICHYLPTQSIIKLHRTSKTMIQKVRLDNGFWRSHFFTGSLHAHLWDLNAKDIEALEQGPRNVPLAPDWDWRSVAKLLATKQFPIAGYDPRLDNMPLGLWNRCRIWSIVEKAFEHDFLEKPFHGQSNSGTDASRYDDA